jgi:hypothetical protein
MRNKYERSVLGRQWYEQEKKQLLGQGTNKNVEGESWFVLVPEPKPNLNPDPVLFWDLSYLALRSSSLFFLPSPMFVW